MVLRCTSCNKILISEDNFTRFKCPSCLKEEIIRCKECRLNSNIYVCKQCGFEGP